MGLEERNFDPVAVVARAKSNGWVRGEHSERDKHSGYIYDAKVEKAQDVILNKYATWIWEEAGLGADFEDCKKSALSKGATLPEMHRLKDFWRFFKDQSSGRLGDRPTPVTLATSAKRFKAGFKRYTGFEMSDSDTREINYWLKHRLPYEGDSGVTNKKLPKYNYQPGDLDRNLRALWTRADLRFSHERLRAQVHWLILIFCHTGARLGGVFKAGIPYKDVHLVLERRASGPYLFFEVDQRTVKNNKNPENEVFGVTGREHPLLRYNAVFLLIQFAIADGALDADHFIKIMEGNGDGPIEWTDASQEVPVCRAVDRQGSITKAAMTSDEFLSVFKKLFWGEYLYARGSMNIIRRAVGKELDERYTETERSQHILHRDPAIFGQSYVASVSSCDGFAAFMREQADHSAVKYFQGLDRFWQPGLPLKLPAALERDVAMHSDILEYDKRIKLSKGDDRRLAQKERNKALKRLRGEALQEHRNSCMKELRRERLLHGCKTSAQSGDADPLDEIIPEKGRIARAMLTDSPISHDSKLALMRDAQDLLCNPWTVYYRSGESPQKNGTCPFCDMHVESMEKRKRCDHIHRCRRQNTARDLAVLPFDLRFCYFCMDFYTELEWEQDCQSHLLRPMKQCSTLTYRSTVVRPAFCLLCKQAEHLSGGERLRYWERDAEAIRHIEEYHGWQWYCAECNFSCGNRVSGYHHLQDAHGYRCKSSGLTDGHQKAECLGEPPVKNEDDPALPQNGTVSPAGFNSDEETIDKLMADFISFPPTPESTPAIDDLLPMPADLTLGTSPGQIKQPDLKKSSPAVSDEMINRKPRHLMSFNCDSPRMASGADLDLSSDGSRSSPTTPQASKMHTGRSIDIANQMRDADMATSPVTESYGLTPAATPLALDKCQHMAKPRIKLRLHASPPFKGKSIQSMRGRKRLPSSRRENNMSTTSDAQKSIEKERTTAERLLDASTGSKVEPKRVRIILKRKNEPRQETEDSETSEPPRRRPRIILR